MRFSARRAAHAKKIEGMLEVVAEGQVSKIMEQGCQTQTLFG